MNDYLTAAELADLIGCQPSSRACMCRWLDKGGWPYEINRLGFPRVSRAYRDARLAGAAPATAAATTRIEPNFGALLS